MNRTLLLVAVIAISLPTALYGMEKRPVKAIGSIGFICANDVRTISQFAETLQENFPQDFQQESSHSIITSYIAEDVLSSDKKTARKATKDSLVNDKNIMINIPDQTDIDGALCYTVQNDNTTLVVDHLLLIDKANTTIAKKLLSTVEVFNCLNRQSRGLPAIKKIIIAASVLHNNNHLATLEGFAQQEGALVKAVPEHDINSL